MISIGSNDQAHKCKKLTEIQEEICSSYTRYELHIYNSTYVLDRKYQQRAITQEILQLKLYITLFSCTALLIIKHQIWTPIPEIIFTFCPIKGNLTKGNHSRNCSYSYGVLVLHFSIIRSICTLNMDIIPIIVFYLCSRQTTTTTASTKDNNS